ncbi:MAG: FixH family protein [Bacteroidota bacterium]
MKLNWGTKLVVAAALFMAFIITMTVKMINEDVVLVENDYYEKGEAYQTTIDANKGADSLLEVTVIWLNNNQNTQVLHIKNTQLKKISNAYIQFYCLANKSFDKRIAIDLNNQEHACSVGLIDFAKGNWTAKIIWNDEQGIHYLEEHLHI